MEVLPPLVVSVNDACRILGIGRTTLYDKIATGEIKTLKIGRKRGVLYRSCEEYVEAALQLSENEQIAT